MKKSVQLVFALVVLTSYNLIAGEWLLIDRDGTRHVFDEVSGIRNDSLSAGGTGEAQRWSLNDIRSLQAPRKSQTLKGMAIGMGIGAAGGVVLGAAAGEDEDPAIQTFAAIILGGAGAVGGTVVGGVAGFALPRPAKIELQGLSIIEKRAAITELIESYYR